MIWRGPWQRTENLFRAWTPSHAFWPCTRETLKTKQQKSHRLPTPSQPLRRYLLSTWTPLSPDMACEKGVRSPHHHRAASLYAGVCFWTTHISNARRPHFLFLRREGREAADPAKPKNATNHGFIFTSSPASCTVCAAAAIVSLSRSARRRPRDPSIHSLDYSGFPASRA